MVDVATVRLLVVQISGEPSIVLWNRMSALPSPLKSSVPIACQVEPGLGSATPAVSVVPLTVQITGVPSVFCHTMSASPSPLKSPVPTICQLAPGLGSVTCDVGDVPL